MAILYSPIPVYAVAIQDGNLAAADTTWPASRHSPLTGKQLQGDDFNFFKPKNPARNLVQYDTALYSVGHVMAKGPNALKKTPPSMIDKNKRDTEHTMLIGDSGGYQIATGAVDDYDPVAMYQWLADHTDLAMIIDIPPWMVGTKKGLAGKRANYTFEDCLKETIENLKVLRDNQYFGHKWLIVMQGETYRQAHVWREAIINELYYVDANGDPVLDDNGNRKPYIPAGFSFAGSLKPDLYRLFDDFLRLLQVGLFHEQTWIHFLGTSQLNMMAFMAVLQDLLRTEWGMTDATLSCDTASAAKSVGISKKFFIGYQIQPQRMAFDDHRFSNYHSLYGVQLPLPGMQTRVSKQFVQNDLIRHTTTTGNSEYDDFSHALLINHTLEIMQRGLNEVIAITHKGIAAQKAQVKQSPATLSDARKLANTTPPLTTALRNDFPLEMLSAMEVLRQIFHVAANADGIDEVHSILEHDKVLALISAHGGKVQREFNMLSFGRVAIFHTLTVYVYKGRVVWSQHHPLLDPLEKAVEWVKFKWWMWQTGGDYDSYVAMKKAAK